MLNELYIENLAVIKEASISFSKDFNVFTGETGAGKSILINGINAVLGRRVYKDIVRSGCEKAIISAFFTDLSGEVILKLGELGISCPDEELLISREISKDGGSQARINSKPVNISAVREIGDILIDIHGQHDSRMLNDESEQLKIIDSFAGLEGVAAEYTNVFKQLQDTARKQKKLSEKVTENNIRIETLKNIIDEIGALEIENDEEDAKIEEEFTIADNAAVLEEIVSGARAILSGGEESSGIDGNLADVTSLLYSNKDLHPEFEEISKRLESLKIEISDINSDISKIGGAFSIDGERYEYLKNRRDSLIKIKKKHGPLLKDVLKKYEDSVSEAEGIITGAEELRKINSIKKELLVEVTAKADELSVLRKKAAVGFAARVEEELKFLDMPNARFVFGHNIVKLTNLGLDSFQMLISVNPGEEPKPINKIASGGELSRIMLAIKNAMAEKDGVDTLIFDEIDSGVSGRAAQKVGFKLRAISKNRQVICVTHLSQIASLADSHLLIEKCVDGGKTFTTVKKLDYEQRKYEIARILGGDNITEKTLQNAEEQLNLSVNL